MKNQLKAIAVVLVLLLLSLPACGQATTAQQDTNGNTTEANSDTAPNRTIQVTGTGQVDVQPDVALVTLGVQTQAQEAETALAENSQQVQQVIDALQEAGVAAEDIQTQALQLFPQFETPPPTEPGTGQPQGPPEIVGYRAANVVQMRVQNLQQIGELVDAAVQAGANQIQNIRFMVSNPEAVTEQAREAAWNQAESRAQQLANLAGAELGPVLTITGSDGGPRPVFEAALGRGAGAEAVPIEAGTETVEVTLNVTWRLIE